MKAGIAGTRVYYAVAAARAGEPVSADALDVSAPATLVTHAAVVARLAITAHQPYNVVIMTTRTSEMFNHHPRNAI